MADDEKTRWAIDVMTAWVDRDGDFMHERIDAYLAEPDGPSGLTTGLVNLSGLLLMGLEAMLGKSPEQILQAIAVTLSRNGDVEVIPVDADDSASTSRKSSDPKDSSE